MIIKCAECKKEVSDTAKICPHCGYELTPQKKDGCLAIAGRMFTWFIGIMFVWALMQGCSDGYNRKKNELNGVELNKNSTPNYENRQTDKTKRLDKFEIERIYSTKRDGESTDFLLYKGQKRDIETLKNVTAELKKTSSKFYLYDDLNVLELNWLMWGAAFESQDYYTKIDKLTKKCKCSLDKHFISADYLLTSDGIAGNYKKHQQTKCSPCNISEDIQELKELLKKK